MNPEERSKAQLKILKNLTYSHIPFMEDEYCGKDDYAYIIERLQYKFVRKGHFVMRQGEHSDDFYFIINGAANVLKWGP